MSETPEDTDAHSRPRRLTQLGPSIRALRTKDGQSQEVFAEACGIRQGTLSDIETERACARQATLETIARQLRVPIAAVMLEREIAPDGAVLVRSVAA